MDSLSRSSNNALDAFVFHSAALRQKVALVKGLEMHFEIKHLLARWSFKVSD